MTTSEKIYYVEEAFRTTFADAVYIETKKVSAGKTSNNIYVPKRFGGHIATVIIWDKIKRPKTRIHSIGSAAEIR